MTASQFWATHPERWLAAIVESSEDAIVGKTLDSVIRSWNAGATQIFGYTADEIIGRPVLVLIPPERQNEEREIVERLSRGERIQHFQTVRVRKDGSRVDVSLSVSPIRDPAGEIVGAAKIARDITEANRLRSAERELSEQLQQQAVELEQQIEESQALQEELEQTNDELQQAVAASGSAARRAEDASRAKSLFFATMNHELRTPLNAVTGYVDLLELGLFGPLTEAQRSSLERIKINGQTLLRLIDDVLDLARLESGRVEYDLTEFRIDDLLTTLETFIAPALRQKGIAYHFEACGPGIRAWADRGKTEQVLLNLLSNCAQVHRGGADPRSVYDARRVGGHRGERHGAGHSPRSPRPDLRAVRAGRSGADAVGQGDGAGTVDQPLVRARDGWRAGCNQRGWKGVDVHARSSEGENAALMSVAVDVRRDARFGGDEDAIDQAERRVAGEGEHD
jgi:PAS domain S-box